MFVDNGLCGCGREQEDYIDDEDWNSMPEEEQNEMLDELARDFRDKCIDFGAFVVEE
jgi:predicted Fe-S protein YdhL (DUF1289 family)